MAEWYPSHAQLDTPQRLEVAFRQVLQKLYETRGHVGELRATVAKMPQVAGTRASQVPVANAAVTNLLGLPIFPQDTTQLADGTKLTWVAAKRHFEFLP